MECIKYFYLAVTICICVTSTVTVMLGLQAAHQNLTDSCIYYLYGVSSAAHSQLPCL